MKRTLETLKEEIKKLEYTEGQAEKDLVAEEIKGSIDMDYALYFDVEEGVAKATLLSDRDGYDFISSEEVHIIPEDPEPIYEQMNELQYEIDQRKKVVDLMYKKKRQKDEEYFNQRFGELQSLVLSLGDMLKNSSDK